MRETASPRQLWVMVFVALLAPASNLPGTLAQGGALGWLGPIVVLPIGLAVLWRVRRLGPGGMVPALGDRWGRLGRGVLTLYYIWAMALAALSAGSCVDRLRRTDYAAAPGWLLALGLAAATGYLVYRGRGAFLRAVEIFYLALVVVLGLFLLLGAANLRGSNLDPGFPAQGLKPLWGAVRGALPAGSTLAVAALAAFFPRGEAPAGSSPGWKWLSAWCLSAAGLCLLVIGALGPELTARAPLPFFLALQGLGFPGGFQRLEALGTAAWVLSDLALLGMAALAAKSAAGDRPWAVWPPLAAAAAGGCLLSNGALEPVAPLLFGVDLALGAALPVALSFWPEGKNRG